MSENNPTIAGAGKLKITPKHIPHIEHGFPSALSRDPSELNVICVIINPVGYKSRYKLFEKFQRHMIDSGVNLVVVEAAFGDREHAITSSQNPNHLQVTVDHELWHKENLINLGLAHLSRVRPTWKYVAWIDADITFTKESWASEVIEALQHYDVIQPWSSSVDLGPSHELLEAHNSFMSVYLNKGIDELRTGNKTISSFGHPGYAWAARRSALDAVGGLMDTPILGAADHHMAWALLGEVEQSVPVGLHVNYSTPLLSWQERAGRHIKRNVGYIPGVILHGFHGSKKKRYYCERWEILKKHSFDPYVDITRDTQGVLRLSGNKPKLRDALRTYFRARNEDSVDLE